jgi:hypothetical protein
VRSTQDYGYPVFQIQVEAGGVFDTSKVLIAPIIALSVARVSACDTGGSNGSQEAISNPSSKLPTLFSLANSSSMILIISLSTAGEQSALKAPVPAKKSSIIRDVTLSLFICLISNTIIF